MFHFTKLAPTQLPQEPSQYYPNTTTLYISKFRKPLRQNWVIGSNNPCALASERNHISGKLIGLYVINSLQKPLSSNSDINIMTKRWATRWNARNEDTAVNSWVGQVMCRYFEPLAPEKSSDSIWHSMSSWYRKERLVNRVPYGY